MKDEINHIVKDFSKNGYENSYVRKVLQKIVGDDALRIDTTTEVKGNISIPYREFWKKLKEFLPGMVFVHV